ncbi:uracil-DNA glycosylase family protein [Noviherbaspirillum sp. UKPF54]|uniref:uracil-DNA glycosylase n=1 Tax=Noviherbaspirillum sp. UKPF54 TaxID=2601898 RepID=UPI0011B14A0D|nr:uracil-DNA glycosylase [Noviherbaspirillum sp. UKPF54]QDZ27773.1 uracil-DNA glycosylase [Noviherbaspirillum sp. UKPF54]
MTSNMQRRAVFLDEIGVGPLWVRRDAAPDEASPPAGVAAGNVEARQPVVEAKSAAVEAAPSVAPGRAGLPEAFDPPSHVPSADEVARMDWAALKASVAGCTKCGLCSGRTQTVFGVGDEKAKWLFVGEGPGRNEDLRGEPFVGPAGKLLDNMLLAMGLRRGENAYIANIVKCRPTDDTGRDRPPAPDEAAACMPYLQRQIALIQPAVIVALGKTAALSLLGLDPETPVSKLRGSVHRYADRPLIVTYHPAYLLRNMADKRKAWADLCLAMATYAGAD